MEPRAFVVRQNGMIVGYLGEGPGPFVVAGETELGFVQLGHARFTSQDELAEDDIGSVLESTSDFEVILQKLEQQGFSLQSVAYAKLFPTRPTESPLGMRS